MSIKEDKVKDPFLSSSNKEMSLLEMVNLIERTAPIKVDYGGHVAAGIALILLAIITTLGNSLVIHAIRTEKRLRTVSNLFLMSLAVADLIIGVIVMPITAAYTIAGQWRWGEDVCKFWLATDYTASTASIFNLVVLTLDSSDEKPYHSFCPAGLTSWCWVRPAEAQGVAPEPHARHARYLAHLPQDLLKRILQVYVDLTRSELLSRCLKKRTQNPYESLHSKLWCSKVKNAHLSRVTFAPTDTVLDHNFGYEDGSFLLLLGVGLQEPKRNPDSEGIPTRRTPKRRWEQPVEDAAAHAPGTF
ncbi:G protein-coupled receptor rhodopsin-like [Trinorchestia longiramus]|nr:G protein-coupled receptor rhodopsin-like [Trinorchestia longiramus]